MTESSDANSATIALAEELGEEVLRVVAARKRPRGSTYRLQFNKYFTFRDATRIVPYLHSLGITHVYASPYLRAQPGSLHGYDVCQHDQLNPEVGTVEEYLELVSALREHGMSQVLDVVPNHMAASSENPWWVDVLENGPSSPYAHFFDIDWHPIKDELADKVLLPILGDQYGQVLEAGQLRLEYQEGSFRLRYFDTILPIGPKSWLPILNHRLDDLKTALGDASDAFLEYQSIITALENLPPASATAPESVAVRQREKEVVKRRLRRLESDDARVADFLRRNVEEFNGKVGDPQSFDRLDQLLDAQAYRLCHWRAASDEVNYRRFFDVNGLAAVSMEAADVFERTHRLILQLAARGDIDGLRIDHIDGLFDPRQYLWRLQWSYLAELGWRVYRQRSGETLDDATLVSPPVLAIARERAESPPVPPTLEPERPTATAEVAGAISGGVLEQDGGSVAIATPVEPSSITWDELRPVLLRYLCDRLALPYPDAELMALGGTGVKGVDQTRSEAQASFVERQFGSRQDLPLYVVVEKILGPDEPLPPDWPVAGTSGYDFLQLLNGVLLSPDGLRQIVRFYERFTGERLEFAEVVYRCKLLILRFSMSSELQMLAHRLNHISEHQRQSRDFTLNMLRHALREILASFPVYRTYAGPMGVSERDRRFVNLAIARSKRRNPATEAAIFEFIRGILLLDYPEGIPDEERRNRELFTGQFQQVTSPVMAKGVEDTAFYMYAPLVSINEVGSHPDLAIVSVEGFHRDNVERLAKFPTTMLATSTHDTKRSEDVRARINVLAEIAPVWRKGCQHWLRLNRRFHREVDGLPAPSRNDEYLFYQTLLGFWPPGEVSDEEHANLIGRLQAYMEKATHEAKVRTSWINPNAAYDEAVREFVGNVLERRRDNRFLTEFLRFLDSIVDRGLYTALSQTVLKLMSPGIPDIYQGQELWDFSLVDPDNRRAVDYAHRSQLLSQLQTASQNTESQLLLAQELAARPRDPRLKLYATWRLLQLRQSEPTLFIESRYVPLAVTGDKSEHVVAFAWQPRGEENQGKQIVVVVPRLLAQLTQSAASSEESCPLSSPALWGDTRIVLPERSTNGGWKHIFSGRQMSHAASLSIAELLSDFPAAVLTDF
jgi:(1->4)-alpha-D-glucan 1-alpha-D-glucosylmutase